MSEFFYTDETKVKDLTVGQLKDIIEELIIKSRGRHEVERIVYTENPYTRPVYPDPYNQPWCATEDSPKA